MRILYLVHQFFPKYYTGTERFTLDLAKQMQRMGHYPIVLTYEPDLKEEGFEQVSKDILKKSYVYETVPVITLKHSKYHSGIDIFDPSIEESLQEFSLKFDLVHICHPMRLSSVIKTCRKLNIPTVLTLTDCFLLCPRALLTVDFRLCNGPEEGRKCMHDCNFGTDIMDRYKDAKFFFDMVDEIVSGSKFVISMFKNNGWDRKIHFCGFGTDYSYVKPTESPSKITFGFIGSLQWHKGAHVLLDAFRKVSFSDIELKIYGEYLDETYYNQLLALAKNDKRIHFLGKFEYKDLPRIMNDISVMVIPSVYYEPYPLVMQTSLAYRIPVIASNIGGMPEAIQNGVNGFLFEPGDSGELAQIIERIVKEPQIIKELKNNITNPIRVEEEALFYENIYRKLKQEKYVSENTS